VHLSPAVDFDLNHGRNISQEAAVRCDPQAAAFAHGTLAPPRFLSCDLDHAPQAGGVERILLGVFRFVSLEIERDDARGTDQIKQILDRIFLGVVRQFVGERVNRESMINVGHAAQPSDADVIVGGAILGAMVGDVERKIVPSQAHFVVRVYGFCVKGRTDGGYTVRCNQAVGLPSAPMAAFIYIAATEWK